MDLKLRGENKELVIIRSSSCVIKICETPSAFHSCHSGRSSVSQETLIVQDVMSTNKPDQRCSKGAERGVRWKQKAADKSPARTCGNGRSSSCHDEDSHMIPKSAIKLKTPSIREQVDNSHSIDDMLGVLNHVLNQLKHDCKNIFKKRDYDSKDENSVKRIIRECFTEIMARYSTHFPSSGGNSYNRCQKIISKSIKRLTVECIDIIERAVMKQAKTMRNGKVERENTKSVLVKLMQIIQNELNQSEPVMNIVNTELHQPSFLYIFGLLKYFIDETTQCLKNHSQMVTNQSRETQSVREKGDVSDDSSVNEKLDEYEIRLDRLLQRANDPVLQENPHLVCCYHCSTKCNEDLLLKTVTRFAKEVKKELFNHTRDVRKSFESSVSVLEPQTKNAHRNSQKERHAMSKHTSHAMNMIHHPTSADNSSKNRKNNDHLLPLVPTRGLDSRKSTRLSMPPTSERRINNDSKSAREINHRFIPKEEQGLVTKGKPTKDDKSKDEKANPDAKSEHNDMTDNKKQSAPKEGRHQRSQSLEQNTTAIGEETKETKSFITVDQQKNVGLPSSPEESTVPTLLSANDDPNDSNPYRNQTQNPGRDLNQVPGSKELKSFDERPVKASTIANQENNAKKTPTNGCSMNCNCKPLNNEGSRPTKRDSMNQTDQEKNVGSSQGCHCGQNSIPLRVNNCYCTSNTAPFEDKSVSRIYQLFACPVPVSNCCKCQGPSQAKEQKEVQTSKPATPKSERRDSVETGTQAGKHPINQEPQFCSSSSIPTKSAASISRPSTYGTSYGPSCCCTSSTSDPINLKSNDSQPVKPCTCACMCSLDNLSPHHTDTQAIKDVCTSDANCCCPDKLEEVFQEFDDKYSQVVKEIKFLIREGYIPLNKGYAHELTVTASTSSPKGTSTKSATCQCTSDSCTRCRGNPAAAFSKWSKDGEEQYRNSSKVPNMPTKSYSSNDNKLKETESASQHSSKDTIIYQELQKDIHDLKELVKNTRFGNCPCCKCCKCEPSPPNAGGLENSPKTEAENTSEFSHLDVVCEDREQSSVVPSEQPQLELDQLSEGQYFGPAPLNQMKRTSTAKTPKEHKYGDNKPSTQMPVRKRDSMKIDNLPKESITPQVAERHTTDSDRRDALPDDAHRRNSSIKKRFSDEAKDNSGNSPGSAQEEPVAAQPGSSRKKSTSDPKRYNEAKKVTSPSKSASPSGPRVSSSILKEVTKDKVDNKVKKVEIDEPLRKQSETAGTSSDTRENDFGVARVRHNSDSDQVPQKTASNVSFGSKKSNLTTSSSKNLILSQEKEFQSREKLRGYSSEASLFRDDSYQERQCKEAVKPSTSYSSTEDNEPNSPAITDSNKSHSDDSADDSSGELTTQICRTLLDMDPLPCRFWSSETTPTCHGLDTYLMLLETETSKDLTTGDETFISDNIGGSYKLRNENNGRRKVKKGLDKSKSSFIRQYANFASQSTSTIWKGITSPINVLKGLCKLPRATEQFAASETLERELLEKVNRKPSKLVPPMDVSGQYSAKRQRASKLMNISRPYVRCKVPKSREGKLWSAGDVRTVRTAETARKTKDKEVQVTKWNAMTQTAGPRKFNRTDISEETEDELARYLGLER